MKHRVARPARGRLAQQVDRRAVLALLEIDPPEGVGHLGGGGHGLPGLGGEVQRPRQVAAVFRVVVRQVVGRRGEPRIQLQGLLIGGAGVHVVPRLLQRVAAGQIGERRARGDLAQLLVDRELLWLVVGLPVDQAEVQVRLDIGGIHGDIGYPAIATIGGLHRDLGKRRSPRHGIGRAIQAAAGQIGGDH